MHYLRSNDTVDHKFRLKRIDPETGANAEVILWGRWKYPKNITILSDEDYAEIVEFDQVKQLMGRLVMQDLPELPQNYYDAKELVQRNMQELNRTKSESEKKDKTIAEKEAEIEALKQKMKEAGIPVE